jgi:hypothetical protein
VGVLMQDGSTCQVLVDTQTKKHVNGVKIVSCKDYQYIPRTSNSIHSAFATPSVPTNTPSNDLSSKEKQLLEVYVKNALMAVATVIDSKVLFFTVLIVVVLPLLYGYLYSTCPPINSFDAKPQLNAYYVAITCRMPIPPNQGVFRKSGLLD